MKLARPSPRAPSREILKAIPYNETTAAEPPIPITVASLPSSTSHKTIARLRRPKSPDQRLSPQTARSKLQDDLKRNSGPAPSSSTTRDSRTTLATDVDSTSSIKYSPSIPSIAARDDPPVSRGQTPGESDKTRPVGHEDSDFTHSRAPFMSILTEIPNGSFEDLTIPGQVEFSKRGSMLIGGKKANKANGEPEMNGRLIGSRRNPNGASLLPHSNMPKRILSADEEALSQKVRSMYETDADKSPRRMMNGRMCETEHSKLRSASSHLAVPEITANGSIHHPKASSNGASSDSRGNAVVRHEDNLAGGIEDWDDLNGGEVDRYGFIVPRKPTSHASSLNSARPNSPDPPRIQRVSTLLQIASDAPRRQRSTLRRPNKSPARSVETPSISRPESRLARPTSSQSSYRTINGRESRMRSAANRLPYNKDRRCVDEAGDMLTLPPGLADIAEDEEDSKAADSVRRREWEREEKWRKMARVIKTSRLGGGMIFEFDTRSPKVIERTWKGIPDRWRATAWHAFLTTSARRRKGSASDDELIEIFKELVDQGSPDDVQIDLDVPRTINSHIMFRRRYRGGQRLLFRVLHCLSIYFPDTGYVQGMAAIAATLLCYFDEEMTFVMLVRMWQLRGLERLYGSGFGGLDRALRELDDEWVGSSEVAAKLVSGALLI